jgi:hypothetical protein
MGIIFHDDYILKRFHHILKKDILTTKITKSKDKKSEVFLYTNNVHSEKEIRETISVMIASKNPRNNPIQCKV